jgi:hypothetical protein
VDYPGSPACTLLGCTLQGKLTLAPSTTTASGLNCGAGTAPTSPVNGDMWCTSSGVFAQINGVTTPLGAIASTITVPQGGTGDTSFVANRPLIGNGTGALGQGTVTTTNGSTLYATASGTPANGNCASWNNGNLIDNGAACTAISSGAVSAGTANQLGYYSSSGSTISGLATCNSGYYGTNGSGVPSCATTLASALQSGITTLGTIATGVWNGTVIPGQYGGTGVANTGFSITLGGNFATSGAAVTLTATGATNVTLPTSGNIPNSAGTSGGIPYYNTSTTIASSAALTANKPVLGGGAGSAPIVGSVTSTNAATEFATYAGSAPASGNCASWDSNHNLTDSGQACGGANAAPVLLATLTGSGVGSLTDVGSACGSTGCLGTTYTSYTIMFANLAASAYTGGNVFCQIQVYQGGYQATAYAALATGGAIQSTNIPCTPPGTITASGIATGISGQVTMYPNGTGKAQWNGLSGFVLTSGTPVNLLFGGGWGGSGTITGFRIYFNSSGGIGSINISGTVKVYGNP